MKLIKKVKIFRKKYCARIRSYYISCIAGLFTGVLIGIFFNLITDITFNRWINPLKIGELFAGFVYVWFAIFLLIALYIIGNLLVFAISKDKKKDYVAFRINFVAGVYAALFSALFVLFFNQSTIRNIIAISAIILFFPTERIAVKGFKK